jgi:hypothetical protein
MTPVTAMIPMMVKVCTHHGYFFQGTAAFDFTTPRLRGDGSPPASRLPSTG